MIITQSRRCLLFLRPCSIPFTHTYQLAAIAKMRRDPMKRKDSRLLALTLSVLKSIVRMSWPCAVPKPVRRTTARQPPSGVHAGSPGLDRRTLVLPNSKTVLSAPSSRDKHPPPAARLIPSGEASIHPRAWHHHRYTRHGRAASRQGQWFRYFDTLGGLWLCINIKPPRVNKNTCLVTPHHLEEVHQPGP